jgi:rRNA maturation protein Nop10
MEQKGHDRLALMVVSTFKLPQIDCPTCGGMGRFVGLERHKSHRSMMVQMFECSRCGEYAIEKPIQKSAGRIFRSAKPG